ncbi:MAG: histidinol-phosphate transaminase [Chromatiales bacterium]
MTERIRRWVSLPVQALTAYPVPDAEGFIKLDAMENPYGWPSTLISEWLDRLRRAPVNRYPDPEARELKARLRRYLDVPDNVSIMLGNGSDELIQIMAEAVAGQGRTILAPEPTFVMYRLIAEVLGFRFVGVPLRGPDFALDVGAMCDAIDTHRPALVFLASPNNPTGNLFERADMETIIERAPGAVVIDEAYYPFAGESWLHELPRHANVLVMQTLSKAGLAGLRIGLLAGAAEWLDQFNKVRLPYNINILSQLSATFILDHQQFLREQAEQIRRDREQLYGRMHSVPGCEVWPSRANFLLFRARAGARAVFERLKARKVLIKCLDGSHPLLKECLRVTVGTPGENALFLEALAHAAADG